MANSYLKKITSAFNCLLVFSFCLTLARAMALPFLVVYLVAEFKLDVTDTGLLLGSVFVVSLCLSVFAGQIIDKFGARLCLAIATLSFATGHLVIGTGMIPSLPLFILCLLWIMIAFALSNVATKVSIGDMVPAGTARENLFSLRYMLINIAYGVGPLIGAALISVGAETMFLGAGILALCLMPLCHFFPVREKSARQNKSTLRQNLHFALSDHRLLFFIFGCLFCSMAMRQFPSYLSQFMLAQEIENITFLISLISFTNAATIISCQHFLTRMTRNLSLINRMSLGCLSLGAGLLILMIASHPLLWILGMIFFTMGEILLILIEFSVIDKIAPEDRRGSYYALQNLGNIGGALSPAVCGIMLALLPPFAMIVILIAALLLSWMAYMRGLCQPPPPQQSPYCDRDAR